MSNEKIPDDKDPAKLRASIAQTRADMSGTLDELHGKLNPQVLKEQALDQFHDAKEKVQAELLEAKDKLKAEVMAELESVKLKFKEELHDAKLAVREATIGRVENMVHSAQDTVRDTGHSIYDTISANPIPAAITGVGLAWLIFSGFQSRRNSGRIRMDRAFRGLDVDGYGYGEGGGYEGGGYEGFDDRPGRVRGAINQVGEKASSVAHTVTDAAGNAVQQVNKFAHHAGERISSATHVAADSVSHFAHDASAHVGQYAHQAQDKAVELARRAQVRARHLEDRSVETYRSNPLAVGAAVLAIGTAIGLAIPRTRREDEWMGEKRDEVFGKAQELAHEAYDRAQEMAHDALGKVEDAAKSFTEEEGKGGQSYGSQKPNESYGSSQKNDKPVSTGYPNNYPTK